MTRRRSSSAADPLRIVFVHPSDELYGADRMLLQMLAAVDPSVEVEVWLPNDLEHPPAEQALCTTLVDRGVTVRHLDLPIMRRAYRNLRGASALLARAARLLRTLRSVRPTVVYCTTSAALLAAPVARLVRVPRVMIHIQEIWSRADRLVLTATARTCHTVLAISSAVAATLPATLRTRTVVVPNGTPEPSDSPPLETRSGELCYVIASRWNATKGHRTLLEAWALAGAPGRLLILGGPPLSGGSVDVPAVVAELPEPTSVSIIGEVSDPAPYFDEADVALMPSEHPEGFGLVAIEAFARGRPVIASAAGGLLDIVTPGEDGWLVPPGDAQAMAAVLAGLDRDIVTRAGRKARRTYERRFTIERFAEDWQKAVLTGMGAADGRNARSPMPPVRPRP